MSQARVITDGIMTRSQYINLHIWVKTKLGTPKVCSKCGFKSENPNQFGWSNNSGKYLKDLSDWERLCKACHYRKDRVKHTVTNNQCVRGHLLEGDNLYIKPSRGSRECRECKRLWRNKDWRQS